MQGSDDMANSVQDSVSHENWNLGILQDAFGCATQHKLFQPGLWP